jgi:cytosine/adenosine deaminase-related metal-dependent hydrolase
MTTTSATLLKNGFLYTADENETIHPNGSVLVVGDRIVSAGDDATVSAAVDGLDPELVKGLRVADARGKLILPGFVNAHWHEMFAMRLGFGGVRPPDDRADPHGFLSQGGDMPRISAVFDRFGSLIDQLRPDEATAVARYSMWTQLRTGTTTLGEMGSLNRPASMAEAARSLGMRAAISTWAADVVCTSAEQPPRRSRDAEQVLAEAEHLFEICADDGTDSLRPRLSAVYITNMSDELGQGLAELAERHDATFAIHVGAQRHESRFIQQVFGQTPIHRLDKLGLLSGRLMAVHCAFADEDEKRLLLERRVHISHSPAKYGSSGESTMTETGLISQLIRAGLDVSLSTDATATPLGGMLENMRAAWQMHNEMHADQNVVVPTRALAMATRTAARGLGWDDEVGSIVAGKKADLVVIPIEDWRYTLSTRPLESLLTLGGSMDVDTVMVDGRIVVAGGRSTTVDEKSVERDYLDALQSFTSRLPGADTAQVAAVVAARKERIR